MFICMIETLLTLITLTICVCICVYECTLQAIAKDLGRTYVTERFMKDPVPNNPNNPNDPDEKTNISEREQTKDSQNAPDASNTHNREDQNKDKHGKNSKNGGKKEFKIAKASGKEKLRCLLHSYSM